MPLRQRSAVGQRVSSSMATDDTRSLSAYPAINGMISKH